MRFHHFGCRLSFGIWMGLVGCAPCQKHPAERKIEESADTPTNGFAESARSDDRQTHSTKPKDDRSDNAQPVSSRSIDELLLFFPAKHPNGNWRPADLKFEDVWFQAKDGTKLHGWYCPCEKPRAFVLYAHGNGGNLTYCTSQLRFFQRKVDAAALIFDYRGYGRSEGTPTVEGILQDARAARSFLARKGKMPETDVVLMGRSLGGAVVIQLAAESRPRALILESTFSSLKDVAAFHYPRLAWLVPSDKLNSVAQLPRDRGPLLLSHGDADRTIPYVQGRKLFEAAHRPKGFVTIAGGDHNDPSTDDYDQALMKFIKELRVN